MTSAETRYRSEVERTDTWPSVSVIVPTRQRPELLRRALRAILDQRYGGSVECKVVFDQEVPVDPGLEIAPGRSVTLLSNDRSPGLAGARNTGILASSSDLIAFCDDDDEWLPDKLRLQVELLRREPAALLVATGIDVIYDGRVTSRIPATERLTFRQVLRSRNQEIHPSSLLARRDVVINSIGLVDEDIPGSYGEDYEWLLRATKLGALVAVRQPLVRVYWHRSSFFADRWTTIVQSITYLLDRFPEFCEEPRGLARLKGRRAFALAAAGNRRSARAEAWAAMRLNWRERRAYVALVVSLRLISAERAQRVVHRFGRGI